jgi:hypothetical protein
MDAPPRRLHRRQGRAERAGSVGLARAACRAALAWSQWMRTSARLDVLRRLAVLPASHAAMTGSGSSCRPCSMMSAMVTPARAAGAARPPCWRARWRRCLRPVVRGVPAAATRRAARRPSALEITGHHGEHVPAWCPVIVFSARHDASDLSGPLEGHAAGGAARHSSWPESSCRAWFVTEPGPAAGSSPPWCGLPESRAWQIFLKP